MKNKFFATKQILFNKLMFSQHWRNKHWRNLLVLGLLIFANFSLHSPAQSYYIDADQKQEFYNMPFPNSKEPSSPGPLPQAEIVVDTLLIGVQPDATLPNIKKTLQVDGIRDLVVEKFWPEFNMALIRLPAQDTSPIMAAHTDAIQRLERYRQTLEQIPTIQYVDYNGWISVPAWTEPMETAQSASTRWRSAEEPANSEEVVVALIDSGYRTLNGDETAYSLWENQAEINGIVGVDDDQNGFIDDYNGWDWIDNDNVANDELGHGTLIGNTMLDVIEQQGIDRHSIEIMPLRILREDGHGEIADLIDALAYAVRAKIFIANISIISLYNAPALEEAIKIVHEQGMLVISVVSSCSKRIYWPAAYPEALATSLIYSREVSAGCHINGMVDIAVEIDASDVISTSSTSLAPPYVTAAAALILGQRPDSLNTDIESFILSTASPSDDLLEEIPVLDINAIVKELETPDSSLRGPLLDMKLYLPLIAN